jgi:hypothetical protein
MILQIHVVFMLKVFSPLLRTRSDITSLSSSSSSPLAVAEERLDTRVYVSRRAEHTKIETYNSSTAFGYIAFSKSWLARALLLLVSLERVTHLYFGVEDSPLFLLLLWHIRIRND